MINFWRELSDNTKLGISVVMMLLVFMIVLIATGVLSTDNSNNAQEPANVETVESPETAPESPPQTEATTSPEFERFMPEITRIVIAPNDVTVYVWCDGSTRVYVMNTASSTKQMQVVRDFAGCPNEHIAGEVIHG